MEAELIGMMINIITPVMEGSIILAAEYAKACDRDYVTSTDVQYGMKYAARAYVGRHTGTLFPELQDEESDDEGDDDDLDVFEEDDGHHPFTRYEGSDQQFIDMNEAFDTWEGWEPGSPVESMLKDAVDKNS